MGETFSRPRRICLERTVELSDYGEIFLNPALSGIVKEAWRP